MKDMLRVHCIQHYRSVKRSSNKSNKYSPDFLNAFDHPKDLSSRSDVSSFRHQYRKSIWYVNEVKFYKQEQIREENKAETIWKKNTKKSYSNDLQHKGA